MGTAMQTKAEMLVLVCLFVPAFSVSCTSCHPRSPVRVNSLHSHPHLLLCPLGPRRAGPSRRRPEVARMCGSIARFRRCNESDDTFDRLRAERDLARAQLDARREEVARLETQLELKRMQLNVSVLQARVMELEHEKHAQQESDTEEEAVRHDADTSALETGACTLKYSRKQPTVTDNQRVPEAWGPGAASEDYNIWPERMKRRIQFLFSDQRHPVIQLFPCACTLCTVLQITHFCLACSLTASMTYVDRCMSASSRKTGRFWNLSGLTSEAVTTCNCHPKVS